MMKAPLSYAPALPAAAGLSAGIALEALGLEWAAAVTCVALFIILYFTRRHYASLFFLMTAVGVLTAIAHRAPRPPEGIDAESHTFMARVNDTDVGHSYTSCLVDIYSVDSAACTPFACQLTVNSLSCEFDPGDTLVFAGKLRPTGSKHLVPGIPDYSDALERQGVYTTAWLQGGTVSLAGRARGIRGVLNDVRRALYNAVVDSPVDAPTASFLTAVILADDRFVDDGTTAAFRSTGVAHMLALSGLHVGLIAMLIGVALYPLGRGRRGRVCRGVLTLVLVWMYVFVVGESPSVVRAAVMITAMLAAMMLQRRPSGWNALCLSVAVLLVMRPSWLFSPGFLMSVAAVASIMAFTGGTTAHGKSWRHRLWLMVITPVAAMLGTGIVGACFFGTVPLMFLPANIVAGLLFPIVLVSGVVLMLATLCGWQWTWLGEICSAVYACMTAAIDWLAALVPALRVHVAWWTAVPYTAMLVCLAASVRLRRRWLMCSAAALALVTVAVAVALTPNAPASEFYIVSRDGRTEAILRQGRQAWIRPFSNLRGLMPDGSLPAYYLDDCTAAYRGYLDLRGVDSLRLMPESLETRDFYGDSAVMVYDRSVYFVAPGHLPSTSMRDSLKARGATVYCLVTDAYDGTPASLAADTLIFGADMHPSRRKRLIRLCGDSIPHRVINNY